MSKLLPLEIRRNFSVKDQGKKWELKCDACSQVFILDKPPKGEKGVPGVVSLMEHARSHPLPPDEVEPEVTKAEPKEERIVELVPAASLSEVSSPPSHIEKRLLAPYSSPSPKNPNPYIVMVQGNVTKVSHFRDPFHTEYTKVQRRNDGYSVTLYAANTKHASLVGERLIMSYISSQRKEA